MTDETIAKLEAEAGQAVTFLRTEAAGLSLRAKLEWLAGVLVLLAIVIAWALWPARPLPEKVEARAEVHQADGSVIAATMPPAEASVELPPPAPATIPRGAKVERRDRIVAQARATAASACPPVTIDLQTVRVDGGRRVIASSSDGSILNAVDVPIDPTPLPPAEKPWAAGLAYGTDRAVGVWLERDIGRLRAGIEFDKAPSGGARAAVRLGVRW